MRRFGWSLALLLLVSPLASAQTASQTVDARAYVTANSGVTWAPWAGTTTTAAATTQAPTASFTNDVRLWVSANSGATWSPWAGVSFTGIPDGTSGAPAIAFASEPTLGFWRTSAALMTLQGALTVTSTLASGARFGLGGTATGTRFVQVANGLFSVGLANETIGSVFKLDALPVASSCGTGSPAVVAGSTPFSGSVTVGTGGPITCTITYGGTAFPNAPHCSGAVETTTAANARAMGYSSSPTVLTIVPATAWADSSVVNWICSGPK